MKKQICICVITILILMTFTLTLASPVFAQSRDQLKSDALAYIQNTDLAELFSRKDDDSPYELNLPEMVWKKSTKTAIYEALYQKVGIDLQEEVQAGRLYVEDDMYYINFKEKKIEKEIIKRQKRLYSIDLKKIGLADLVQVDGLNLEKLGLTDISDLKFLINLRDLYLSNNKKILNYTILIYLKILRVLFLDNNNLSDISFLNDVPDAIEVITLRNNQISDISIISKFKDLEWLFLSNNKITSLKAIKSNKLKILMVDGNPITIGELKYIEKLCYSEVLYKLYIDRAVFKEYGDHFALYPEYLQWIDYIYFVEKNGKVTEWHVITY